MATGRGDTVAQRTGFSIIPHRGKTPSLAMSLVRGGGVVSSSIVEIKRLAKGLQGIVVHEHYFICGACEGRISRNDIFCRVCGREFLGTVEHREVGP